MGEGIGVDTIINGLAKGWEIVKDNRPASSAKGSFCQAIPGNYPFSKISGWKHTSKSWGLSFHNLIGEEICAVEFVLDYQWGGEINGVKGLFLTNFNVWCKSIDVGWGWTMNVDATVSGNPFNAGSKDHPVGAIPLVVSWQLASYLQSKSRSIKITARGNGNYDTQ
jgi:hypothetical protein